MKYSNWLVPVVTSALVITIPQQVVKAQVSAEQIANTAREVTVLIKNSQDNGSGVIISKNGNTYYVLTAYHVLRNEDNYQIITHDKIGYKIDYSTIKRIPETDLAVFEFQSEKELPVATLGNSDSVKEGALIFVSGWPKPDAETKQTIRQFSEGRVSSILDTPVQGGYKISYTNVTRGGMSGGPVFDAAGRVVGIHGLGGSNGTNGLNLEGSNNSELANVARTVKTGFNYGTPINTFLQTAPQSQIYLSLKVDNSPSPKDLSQEVVVSQVTQTDDRDKISNVDSILNNIGRTLNIINGVRSIFGF